MDKKCTKCKKTKDVSYFYFRVARGAYHAWCKQCMATVGHDRYRDRKTYVVNLFGGKCSVCGYNRNVNALDFHHLDPSQKEGSWATMKHSAWEELIRELNKCVLVCKNCHAEIHWPQKQTETKMPLPLQGAKSTGVCAECGIDVFGSKFCSTSCTHANATKRKEMRTKIIDANWRRRPHLGNRKVERPESQQLHDLIWQMPTTAVAKRFQVSDKAVEKWCKSYQIQKPPRGYWAKVLSESRK